MAAARQRVGVLLATAAGTSLVPGLVVARDGVNVTVLIERDGAFTTVRTLLEYAQPPALPETAAAWQWHWQRLEDAADNPPEKPGPNP